MYEHFALGHAYPEELQVHVPWRLEVETVQQDGLSGRSVGAGCWYAACLPEYGRYLAQA